MIKEHSCFLYLFPTALGTDSKLYIHLLSLRLGPSMRTPIWFGRYTPGSIEKICPSLNQVSIVATYIPCFMAFHANKVP